MWRQEALHLCWLVVKFPVSDAAFVNLRAATLEDTYTLKADGALHVKSVVRAGSRVEETLQVYRRADRWQPQNDWAAGGALGVGTGWRTPFSR